MINGDGDNYLAWLKIDFSQKDSYGNNKVEQFHDRYGYNLEKALDRFPIKELGNPESKADLVASMKAGNLHPVVLVKGDKAVELLPFSRDIPEIIWKSYLTDLLITSVYDVQKLFIKH